MLITPHVPVEPSPICVSAILSLANRRVLVAAHRGDWSSAPENSLPAIEDAIAHGADIVELDVRATGDGVLVLLHDATLDRTSDQAGLIAKQDFSQVRHACLKARDGIAQPLVPGARLPTLASALEVARHRVVVNIDVKDATLVDRAAQAVVAAGMADQVFVKARVALPQDMERVRASPFFGRVEFVPMIEAPAGHFCDILQWLAPLGCPMYEVEFTDLADLESGRAELCRQGARLWVNTIQCSHSLDFNDARARIDPDAVWGCLLDVGVGAMQTDEVAALVDYLKQKARR